MAEGGHGGADPLMLADVFAVEPPADLFRRAATYVDGAASILVGIAANISIESGELIQVNKLFDLGKSPPTKSFPI